MGPRETLAEITAQNLDIRVPLSSVVVHYLDIVCISIAPGKADPPTVVDANTVLAVAVAPQGLQPVAPNCTQIRQASGGVQPSQPLARLILDTAKLPTGK